jgi:hypothetical protein
MMSSAQNAGYSQREKQRVMTSFVAGAGRLSASTIRSKTCVDMKTLVKRGESEEGDEGEIRFVRR